MLLGLCVGIVVNAANVECGASARALILSVGLVHSACCCLITIKMQAGLSEADLRKLMMVEELKHYNQTVEKCFKECVWSMTSKDLTTPEMTCLENCYKKVLNFNERMGQMLNVVVQQRSEAAQQS